jgi:dolichyl-phosphate beta-glucosyltransferase
MGQAFNVMVRLLTRLPFRDTQCGFKLFTQISARAVFAGLRTQGFAYDVEILLNARDLGLRVVDVPVRWSNHPETTVAIFRSSARMTLDLLSLTLRRGVATGSAMRRAQERSPRS